MGALTPAHLLLILIIALIIVGPGKLPEVGSAIGRSVREFQKSMNGVQEAANQAVGQTLGQTLGQTPAQTQPMAALPQPPAQTYAGQPDYGQQQYTGAAYQPAAGNVVAAPPMTAAPAAMPAPQTMPAQNPPGASGTE